jgi:hypothetical protein
VRLNGCYQLKDGCADSLAAAQLIVHSGARRKSAKSGA